MFARGSQLSREIREKAEAGASGSEIRKCSLDTQYWRTMFVGRWIQFWAHSIGRVWSLTDWTFGENCRTGFCLCECIYIWSSCSTTQEDKMRWQKWVGKGMKSKTKIVNHNVVLPVIPAFWRWTQENHCEFSTTLIHIASYRPARFIWQNSISKINT